MVNQAAFDLIVNNMRENDINNKKTFARYMLGEPVGDFAQKLLDAWIVADGDSQERLATGFPQIASCMLEWQTLPEKKRKKYLEKLINKNHQ